MVKTSWIKHKRISIQKQWNLSVPINASEIRTPITEKREENEETQLRNSQIHTNFNSKSTEFHSFIKINQNPQRITIENQRNHWFTRNKQKKTPRSRETRNTKKKLENWSEMGVEGIKIRIKYEGQRSWGVMKVTDKSGSSPLKAVRVKLTITRRFLQSFSLFLSLKKNGEM